MPTKRLSCFEIGGITVVNMAHTPGFGDLEGDVRIDRASKWGNQFRMANDSEAERDRVCDAYSEWLEMRLRESPDLLLPLMGARRLGCWCAPKRCHGESLARAIVGERRREG